MNKTNLPLGREATPTDYFVHPSVCPSVTVAFYALIQLLFNFFFSYFVASKNSPNSSMNAQEQNVR